jgi:hypothetical protein
MSFPKPRGVVMMLVCFLIHQCQDGSGHGGELRTTGDDCRTIRRVREIVSDGQHHRSLPFARDQER